MNEQRGGDKGDCYYHPKEVYVGVCPLCLYERLLILSAKQAGRYTKNLRSITTTATTTIKNSKPPPIVVLPKFFALTSFFNRFESSRRHHHHRNSHNLHDDDCSSTVSQDDSFISIQFENNGAGSWEKNKVSKVSLDPCNKPWDSNNQILNNKGSKSVLVEHTKPRATSLRWRKRIGHLFHVMRWKRGNKGNMCHVGSKKMQEGVNVRNGWIRTLTKRKRTKE